MTTKLQTPTYSDNKSYDTYKNELAAWRLVTKVPKKEQGITLALHLPEGSKIREKVFEEIDIPDLNTETGYETLIGFFDKHLGKDDLADSLNKFEDFENCTRQPDQCISDYIDEFDQKYNRIKKKGMTHKSEILAFKLIGKANVSRDEKMLILTGVDFTKRDTLYDQAKQSLKKFKGGYTEGASTTSNSAAIKLEPAFLAEHEEALMAAGFVRKPPPGGRGRGGQGKWSGGQGRGHYYRGGGYTQSSGNQGYSSGGSAPKFSPGPGWGGGARPKTQRYVNPLGPDGEPLRCRACGSFRHLVAKCPDSYENMANVKFVSGEGKEEEAVLFTGYDRKSVIQLGEEARNCAVLDSACTSTVCGEAWMQGYLESLSDDDKGKVEVLPGEKLFKFGGGERLKSQGSYKLPAVLAGKDVTIRADVVSSGIPLLLSKDAMKKAEVKMNLKDDTAEIFGKNIALNLTTSGHYCVPIDRNCEIKEESVCSVKLADMSNKDKLKTIQKLHRQFAHPPARKLKTLMKDAAMWQDEYDGLLDKIHSMCDLCKQYAATPPRPAVSLPMAKEFNDKVSMDLKKWKNKWILHLIDMWSRLTISCFIQRKKPSEVVDKIMINWVGAGFGVMKSLLSDNGGEFNAEEVREVASILNVVVLTTAAESPFQNGLNERNHSVTDFMLTKLEADFPNVSSEVLLAWANTAKNSMQMHHGFSSYQLVFGKNPNLPNIMYETPPALAGTTTSESLTKHLNTLHKARVAFTESEAAERVRRALRCKIRAAEQRFEHGDLVYYKREGHDRWLGPGKVVFQDGKVIFIRHGGVFVRVSPNRLLKAGNEYVSCRSGASVEKENVGDQVTEEARKKSNNKANDLPTVIEETEDDTSDEENIREANNGQNARREPEREGSGENERETGIIHQVAKFRQGEKVMYKRRPSDEWTKVEILGRAGKATGKYSDWFNIRHEDGEEESLDFRQMAQWQKEEDEEKVNVVIIPKNRHGDIECLKSKQVELQKLKAFGTYEEVKDTGQFRISTTWTLCQKGNGIRARLVARGFEDISESRKDAPTVAKASMRIIMAVAASKGWQVKTTDIKSAFLQGKQMEREVFIKPPKEADVSPGYIWRLKHCLYGLNDAAHHFYQSVLEELKQLGCEHLLDPAVFCKRQNGDLIGVVASHIDDFLHAGTTEFDDIIMKKLCLRFLAGKVEKGKFHYVGFKVKQDDTGIVLDQSEYLQELENPVLNPVLASKEKDMDLSARDQTCLRQLVRKLNWLVQGTRPDMAYEMIDLSTKLQKGQVKDLVRAVKCLRKLKDEEASLRFSRLSAVQDWRICVHSDASHANLDHVMSVGGYVVFLVDKHGCVCPINWKANKIKRVVRSSLAAEALSLQEALDDSLYLRRIMEEMLGLTPAYIPIQAYVDNRGLVESLHTTKLVDDKRLRIDLAAIKELIHGDQKLSVTWVPGVMQLADCLTKRGAPGHRLLELLQTGIMCVN